MGKVVIYCLFFANGICTIDYVCIDKIVAME